MRRSTILAVALALVSLWLVLSVDIRAVWLTEELRVYGLVILLTAIAAALLVLYFGWRGRLRRQMLAERDDHHAAA